MKLHRIARKFDNLEVVDAYNPTDKFKAQLLDSSPTLRDAITNERRTLSIDPSIEIFAGRTVVFNRSTWICGVENRDYYRGKPIRKEVLVTMVDGAALIVTASQAIAGVGGKETYASRIWIKTVSEVEYDSTTPNRYDIYFPIGEKLDVGDFIYLSETWHIIRSQHVTPSGYQVAVTEELPRELIVDVEYGAKQYDPVNDVWVSQTFSSGTVIASGTQLILPADTATQLSYPVTLEANASILLEQRASLGPLAEGVIRAIPLRWQTHYYYMQQATTKFNLGDIVLQVRKTDVSNPQVGHKVKVSKLAVGFATRTATVSFRVVNLLDEGDYWSLHLSND